MSHATFALGERSEAGLPGRPVVDAPAMAAANDGQARNDARLHHLFRHALRAGQVNPLLHLIPASRGASAP